jgi:hypothetical protein
VLIECYWCSIYAEMVDTIVVGTVHSSKHVSVPVCVLWVLCPTEVNNEIPNYQTLAELITKWDHWHQHDKLLSCSRQTYPCRTCSWLCPNHRILTSPSHTPTYNPTQRQIGLQHATLYNTKHMQYKKYQCIETWYE